MAGQRVQIGEVAERTGLSLRTIRYYEEVGLVVPARTQGGFRLYGDVEIERLLLIKRMKPLGFSLEEMRDLLEITDRLNTGVPDSDRAELIDRLRTYEDAVAIRSQTLREQLAMAEEFAARLRDQRHGATRGAATH